MNMTAQARHEMTARILDHANLTTVALQDWGYRHLDVMTDDELREYEAVFVPSLPEAGA